MEIIITCFFTTKIIRPEPVTVGGGITIKFAPKALLWALPSQRKQLLVQT